MIPPSEITILWSTQGGRAKACARRTSRILRDYYFLFQQQSIGNDNKNIDNNNNNNRKYDYDHYYGTSFDDFGALEFLKLGSSSRKNKNKNSNNGKQVILMFVSTTGDGEHCDNIQDTWKVLLQKSLPKDLFSNKTIALFCLGDRAYGPTAFCAAGRKLATRLLQLGATLFCNIGYGDDGTPNGGVFYDLDIWIEQEFIPKVLSDTNNNDKVDGMKRISMQEKVLHHHHHRTRRILPSSPYQVVFSSIKNTIDTASYTMEEWQMQQYHNSYNTFFESIRPKTAYRYDSNTGCRISSILNDSTKQQEQQQQQQNNDNSNSEPLIGCIVSNQRLTSKQWIQDTRHIQIHIETTKQQHHSSLAISNDPVNTNTNNNYRQYLPYLAGDIATIIPFNSNTTVEKFISCLPLSIQSKVDVPISIATNITPSTQYKCNYTNWPSFCTLRGLLTFCADISSLPEREDLRSLSLYCNPLHPMGGDQQAKLVSLSETTDAALYGDYIIREKRNWSDVLFDFDSIGYEEEQQQQQQDEKESQNNKSLDDYFVPLSIDHLLIILSPIMPRHFSIASAPSLSSSSPLAISKLKSSKGQSNGFNIELCVAVVKGKTSRGRQYEGLCSNYLSNLRPTSYVRLWIRPGSFGKLPLEMNTSSQTQLENNVITEIPRFQTPIICIGSGTGVAPLRSLIFEREAIRNMVIKKTKEKEVCIAGKQNINNCDNVLVFGCRKQSEDYYYQKEWDTLAEAGSLKVLTAFSRDQKHKMYVQRVIREADDNNSLIARHILENGGAIYIAGGAKMARSVKEEIIECLSKYLPTGIDGAKQLLVRLQRVGKFNVEAWS